AVPAVGRLGPLGWEFDQELSRGRRRSCRSQEGRRKSIILFRDRGGVLGVGFGEEARPEERPEIRRLEAWLRLFLLALRCLLPLSSARSCSSAGRLILHEVRWGGGVVGLGGGRGGGGRSAGGGGVFPVPAPGGGFPADQTRGSDTPAVGVMSVFGVAAVSAV